MPKTGAVNWDQLEWQAVRPGVKRKLFHGKGCSLVMNALEPGHEPWPHSHAHEQIVYILQGEAEFILGPEKFRLSRGDLLSVPPNVEHFLRVLGKKTCLDLDIFIPKREDYPASKIKA